jgi:superfamily II DNA or RNA helicase
MSTPATLHDAIRKEAKPGLWSLGVKLARDGAVVEESRTASEVVLRVKAPGRPVAWTVVLYPGDEAWECNCPAHFDPCEHVVAGAITLQQAQTQGTAVVTAEKKWSRVVYRFSRVEGGLQVRRAVAHADGSESPMETSLALLLMNPAEKARLQIEQHDLAADRLLERAVRGPLPADRLESILTALENARTVLLDGVPVAVSGEVVLPRVIVDDQHGQFVVTLVRDPRITEVLSPGVALCADMLCRLAEAKLPPPRTFTAEQLGELTGKVLPDLARRFPVEVRSKRLPAIDRELKPRIQLELNQVEQGLSALPTLVYGAPPTVRIDGGRMVYLRGAVPLRDEAVEQRLIHSLREQLDLLPGRRMTFSGPDMVRFADKLRKWRGDLTGDAARVVSPDTKLRPVIRTQAAGQGVPSVDFAIEFQIEGAKPGTTGVVDAASVLRAWNEGLGLVPIEGGGWAPLPTKWLEQHGQRVADLLAARGESGKLANHALPQLGELCDALETPRPPGLEKLAPLLEGFERIPEAPLPEGLTATLRPYQRHGVSWLRFLAQAGLGGVLADDMGLGKTLQTICVLGTKALVVCPTSVLPNWAAELRKFRPSLKVATYHGPTRALDPAADVTLTTYALLRLDEAALTAKEWDTVVLDEAQMIKNPDSQTARAAFKLKGAFRVALSGTPIENRLEELWSVMHFANPGLLRGRREFQELWAQPIADGRADSAQSLRRKIKPFVLRRLKRDVAPELPPRTESVMHVVLDDRERAIYDAVFAATRTEVVNLLQGGGSVLKALEALLRLRQAACHSALIPGQQKAQGSSKITALLDALGTAAADGHRALVFSQWTSLLDLIEPELKAANLAYERLDGSTPDRAAVTERFQAPDGPPVMLISLKAGGLGLNLTAADHVFLVDPWWNPAVESQAADRAHRIGQERPVFVYRLVSQGTVEEKILLLQDKKRALFEAALGEGTAAGGLTRDDLLELFNGPLPV